MANATFTVTHEPEDEYLTIECEWTDVFSPPELDDKWMPILDKAGIDFKRVPDDLDYRTIRVSNVFLEDAVESLIGYDAEKGILTIGEWVLQSVQDEPEYDRQLFQHTSEDFPRKTSVKILASDYYKPYNR